MNTACVEENSAAVFTIDLVIGHLNISVKELVVVSDSISFPGGCVKWQLRALMQGQLSYCAGRRKMQKIEI